MAPCWILPIPKQNAAEKLGKPIGFAMDSNGGRMPRTERTGTGHSISETFEILGNLSISL